jgi:hypothetical protein
VTFEINYEPHDIPISRACGLVWNCTDIIPGTDFDMVRDCCEPEPKMQTYAACARAMYRTIREMTT